MKCEHSTVGPIAVRNDLCPGDLGAIVQMHGVLYARECGWDASFEAYVAGRLSEFVQRASLRERIWIAEGSGRIVGSIALIAASQITAQLRWFLVDPSARGVGLGKRLLDEAVSFARTCGYADIILWTEKSLHAAAHLYEIVGFRLTETKLGKLWGRNVIEEKYELKLS